MLDKVMNEFKYLHEQGLEFNNVTKWLTKIFFFFVATGEKKI